MALKLVKATDPIAVKRVKVLLYGQPGVGKTSVANAMTDPLTLDADDGVYRSAFRKDSTPIGSWNDCMELASAAPPELDIERRDALVCDTFGRIVDLVIAHLLQEDAREYRDGRKLYGEVKIRVKAWTDALLARGKDVIMVCHAREEEVGKTKVFRPDIVGGSLAEMLKMCDFVGFVWTVGDERCIEWAPGDQWFAKNPAGWGRMAIPNLLQQPTFLVDVLAKGRLAMGKISEESARVAQLVTGWEARLAAVTGADGVNALGPEIKALEPMALHQVRRLLMDRAKALGLVPDRERGCYVLGAPPPQPPQPPPQPPQPAPQPAQPAPQPAPQPAQPALVVSAVNDQMVWNGVQFAVPHGTYTQAELEATLAKLAATPPGRGGPPVNGDGLDLATEIPPADKIPKAAGKRAKEFRKDSLAPLVSCAEKAGMDVDLYVAIESGDVTPTSPQLIRMANAIGASYLYLLTGKDSSAPTPAA